MHLLQHEQYMTIPAKNDYEALEYSYLTQPDVIAGSP